MVEVVNVVASGHLGRELDLAALATDLDAPTITYQPERFPGLQVWFEKTNGVIILYSTGSYSIMGAKKEQELDEIYDAIIEGLSKLNFDVNETAEPPVVKNLICKGDIDRELDLSALSVALGMERVEYEPEQSPFIYYWPEGFDCLITIPTNGEVIVTGVETVEAAKTAFEYLKNRIGEILEAE